jgi:hypothetical protein
MAAGRTLEDVLHDYPYLEREDILQALGYAAWLAEEREVVLPNILTIEPNRTRIRLLPLRIDME